MNSTTNNTVILVGNLGNDPIEKGGGAVELRMCTERGRGISAKQEWHTVKAFGELGQNCLRFLKKGRKVGVIGRLTYFVTDATKTEDNKSRAIAEVVADQVDFL